LFITNKIKNEKEKSWSYLGEKKKKEMIRKKKKKLFPFLEAISRLFSTFFLKHNNFT